MFGQEMVSKRVYDTNINLKWCTNNNDLSFPFFTVFPVLGGIPEFFPYLGKLLEFIGAGDRSVFLCWTC